MTFPDFQLLLLAGSDKRERNEEKKKEEKNEKRISVSIRIEGCAGDIMVNGLENKISKPNSNSG